MNLRERSYQLELLDKPGIPFDAIKRNMQELETINTWLGGHSITIDGFKQCLALHPGGPIRVCEIGCGGGDNLQAIKKFCDRKNITVKLTGIDINGDCIEFARKSKEEQGIGFIHSDYRNYHFDEKPDILFSSLFCHHFKDAELVMQLHWMRTNSRLGFFINDLHRHRVAYIFIKCFTGLFSKSYLVKNDAPLSVSRGFTRKEWKRLLSEAGIGKYKLSWKWAFRWLLVVA